MSYLHNYRNTHIREKSRLGKKIFLTFLFSFIALTSFGQVEGAAPIKSENVLNGGNILSQEVKVKDYTTGTTWAGETCKGKELRCVAEKILTYLKKLLIPIAIVSITFAGLYLLIVRNNEEEFKKRKNEVFGVFAGFIVILLSASLIDNMFFGSEGQILQGEDNTEMAKSVLSEITGLLEFLKTFIVPSGLLVLIFYVFKLIFRSDEEEEMEKMKKRILYIIVGIAVILISEEFVKATFGGEKIHVPEAEAILSIGVKWINIILGFLGVIGVFVIVWAGTQMVFHFGDEELVENSKNIIKFVVIGLVVAFSAWTIVRFFLMGGV